MISFCFHYHQLATGLSVEVDSWFRIFWGVATSDSVCWRNQGGCRSHLQIINSLSQDTTHWLMMSMINHWPPSTPDLRSPPGDQPPTYTNIDDFHLLNFVRIICLRCTKHCNIFLLLLPSKFLLTMTHCFVFSEFNSIDFHFNCVNRFLWKTSAFIWILISTSMRPQSRVSHKSVNHN